jgi:hypothetical protein
MNAQQGPSITSYTTPNALPRDIRVWGSKSANTTHPWARILILNARKTRITSINTQKHNTQPENTVHTPEQHATSNKKRTSTNSHWKEVANHRTRTTQCAFKTNKLVKKELTLENTNISSKLAF